MNCPNCQTNLPEGAVSCPNCATPVPYPNAFSNPIPTDGMQKKPKKGLIIGISFGAVIMIAALITCILYFIIGQKDGTYVCEDLSAYGVDVTLKVNGNKCELKMSGYGESESEKGTIKFNGKKVTVTINGDKSTGTYNKSKKTIELDGMTFKKK